MLVHALVAHYYRWMRAHFSKLLSLACVVAGVSLLTWKAHAQSGGITLTSWSLIGGSTTVGALRVTILPTEIQTTARWRLLSPISTSYYRSGSQRGSLTPRSDYVVNFLPVDGYSTPSNATAAVFGGQLTDLTVTYGKNGAQVTAQNPEAHTK